MSTQDRTFALVFLAPFDRISVDPLTMGGKPCIRGKRVTVGVLVGQIARGLTIDELLADYPYLDSEDVHQALAYAAWRPDTGETSDDRLPTDVTKAIVKIMQARQRKAQLPPIPLANRRCLRPFEANRNRMLTDL